MRHRLQRPAAVAMAVTLVGVLASSAALGSRHPSRPDLVVAKVSSPHSPLGHRFAVTVLVRNAGRGRARASRTLFFLSADRRRGSQDPVAGSARVPGLRARAHKSVTARLTVPQGTKPGSYFVIACADGARRVTETREGNNCRTTRKAAILRCARADVDCDGYLPPRDCNDHDAAIHPGVADKPDLQFVDSNCDGIDGDATHAAFVSPIGDDGSPGTRARPKRTFAAAIAAVPRGGDVYATFGTYPETLFVHDGVGVYGGYDTSWRRSLANVTRLVGGFGSADSLGASASDVTAPTVLQLLTLAPGAATGAGGSSYGLWGIRSGGLRLERLTVQAGAGAVGGLGAAGTPGQPGGAGQDGGAPTGGPGGTAPIGGHVGGAGGDGGDRSTGDPGSHGQATFTDSFNREGGPGGAGGATGSSSSTRGGP
ncbi:MAG: hypothetical protein QOK31_1094, partial [Solirubrobacteraceae bacterium]|nr:hypothetical protein [Solirubrobacteraceae bacterium]